MRRLCLHLQFTVTWPTRMVLAWQSSVTTVRTGHQWVVLKVQEATRSRDIHYTWASLSQLASLTNVSSYREQFIKYECLGSLMLKDHMLGGCHVNPLTWPTGAKLSQEVMSAHAWRTRHVQFHNMAVTAIKMTMYDVKTTETETVSLLTKHTFRLNS